MKKQIKNFGIYALSAIVFVAVLFLSIEKSDNDEYTLMIGVSPDDKEIIGVDYTNEKVYTYRLP